MELFPVGKVFDFMGVRRYLIGTSLVMFVASLIGLVYPGPVVGTDFRGGTEVEVAFPKPVDAEQIRGAVSGAGLSTPEVVSVQDAANPYRFILKIQEVTTISPEKRVEIERALCFGEVLPQAECPVAKQPTEVKFSPGGDKLTLRYRDEAKPLLEGTQPELLGWIRQRMQPVSQISLREGKNNPFLQNPRDNKVEIQLKSKGDQIMDALRSKLGPDRVPAAAMRTEWIGPKAGAQLRNAAILSVSVAIVFIMVYLALRFDYRFAPGAVVSMLHDAVIVLGAMVLCRKEISLSTVAAILMIVSYSVNDTVVVYDRIRENLGKLRGVSFSMLINISISEMLSRTMLSSATTIFSLLAFFVWGTGPLKEFAWTLVIGMVFGTYSSIYIALPVTEIIDRRLLQRMDRRKRKSAGGANSMASEPSA
jgi:preprotein translocase subunit SecF